MLPESLRPNADRGRIALAFLVLKLAGSLVLSFWPALLAFQNPRGTLQVEQLTEPELFESVGTATLALLSIRLVALIFIIRWFRRAYFNLHLCGIQELRYSEGWAAGAWFLPITNLIRPYQIMTEIWYYTQYWYQPDPNNYRHRSDLVVRAWWTMNICSVVLTLFSSALLTGNGNKLNSLYELLTSLLSLADLVLFFVIIRQLLPMEAELNLRAQQHAVAVAQQQENYAQLQQMQQQTTPDQAPPPTHEQP